MACRIRYHVRLGRCPSERIPARSSEGALCALAPSLKRELLQIVLLFQDRAEICFRRFNLKGYRQLPREAISAEFP
jgi:hypothetical protein